MTTASVMVRPQGFALFKEGCMLRGIEEARFWIPVHFLPSTDGGPVDASNLPLALVRNPNALSRRWISRRVFLVRPIWSSVSCVASSETAAVSSDATCQGLLIGSALTTWAPAKIPKTATARIKAPHEQSFLTIVTRILKARGFKSKHYPRYLFRERNIVCAPRYRGELFHSNPMTVHRFLVVSVVRSV
jgi:hypothetical protein